MNDAFEDLCQDCSAGDPNEVVFSFYDRRGVKTEQTREEFIGRINSARAYVQEKGWVGKRIALLQENNLQVPAILFGLMAGGAVAVPLNPGSNPEDLRYIISHARVQMVLVEESDEACKKLASDLDVPVLENGCLFTKVGASHNGVLRRENQPSLLLYTSGTTARPKCVALTPHNLISNARGLVKHFGLHRAVQLTTLPLYHAHAFGFGLLSSCLSGGRLIIMAGMDPALWSRTLAQEKVNWTSIVPNLLQLLRLTSVSAASHPDLHGILVSSAPLIEMQAQKFEKRTGIPIIHGWGQTEFTNFATLTDLEGSMRDFSPEGARTVGSPIDGVTVKIVNDAKEILEDGVVGELHLDGPSLMLGYMTQEGVFEKPTNPFGLPTGDLGYRVTVSGKEYFFIKGRCKELIIRNGEKLSPAAIESKAREVLDSEEIALCALGFQHDVCGQQVGLYIDIRTLPTGWSRQLIENLMSVHQSVRPLIIHLGEIDIPRTFTGKIQRAKLTPLFDKFNRYSGKGEVVGNKFSEDKQNV